MKRSVAARKFSVPATTLFDHVSGKHLRIGARAPTVLSPAEEKEIVVSLQVLQEIGFGLTKDLVGVIIHDYLKDQPTRPNPFQHGIPGHDWWRLFLKRWNTQLSVRKPQHLPTSRASAARPQAIEAWFDKVKSVLRKIGLAEKSPEDLQDYLWNCDETGFCSAQACQRILAKRGKKDVQDTIGGSGREYFRVLAAGSAGGVHLPPYFVYKGKNLWSRWMQGGPAVSLYSVSDGGWMESANFKQWVEKMFIPAVKYLATKGPVVLFFDGHHYHISLQLIELARDNIHLFCLPPHSTHLLKPLDVSVFGPMKKAAWNRPKQISEAGILHVSELFNTTSPNSVFLFQLMATPEVMKMKVYAKDVKGGRRMTAKISKTLGLVVITAGGGTTSCVLASVRSLKNIGAVLIVRR